MGIVEQLIATYKGRKVFLTGHTGFKGSWLLILLNQLGASIKAYSLPAESKSLYHQIKGDTLCQSVFGDIRNLEHVRNEIASFQPDFIFHLAAQALVLTSYEEPVTTFETNVMGTANILDSLRQLSGQSVSVFVTTDKVYENLESGKPFKETDPLGGYDPYSASKAASEILISSYRNSYFSNNRVNIHQKSISSARAGNVIGGGDWSTNRLIPDVIRSLVSNREIIIRSPEAIRPWQHVLEPLVGYLTLGMRQSQQPAMFNEGWNFGPYPEQHHTVEEIVNTVIKLWGSGRLKIEADNHSHEAKYLKLDIAKVKKLGWRPQLNLDETLKWTVSWYRRTELNREDPAVVTQEQVSSYLEMIR